MSLPLMGRRSSMLRRLESSMKELPNYILLSLIWVTLFALQMCTHRDFHDNVVALMMLN